MIQARNVSYTYPDGTKAVRSVSFTVDSSTFTIICGANGQGKTSLLTILAGLTLPSHGSVVIYGHDTRGDAVAARKHVGLVFQNPDDQIVGETVTEDVAFGPENQGLKDDALAERVEWALGLFDLKEVKNRPCYSLSGGQKRRVALAGVVAMKPDVLLLDEPFSNLDLHGTQSTLQYLLEIHRQGTSVLVATHNVDPPIAYADRLLVLRKGGIVADGTPSAIAPSLGEFGVRPPSSLLYGGRIIPWLEV